MANPKKAASIVDEVPTVRPAQLTDLLMVAIPAHERVLIVGSPGIGKTEIVAQAVAALNKEATAYDLQISHPSVEEPADAIGIPWPDKEEGFAKHLPFERLHHALSHPKERQLVWFIDDLGQGTPATQAAYMQLLDRQHHTDVLQNVTIIAATNRRGDKAGVSGLLEPVKSRFSTIVHLAVNIDDFVSWAMLHNVQAEVMGFLRWRPGLLNDFQPTSDLVNSPCPRTWTAVSRLLRLGLPGDLELAAIGGAVGKGAAAEFTGFLRVYRDLPDLDEILKQPDKAPLVPNENTSALYAVSVGLAARADRANFGAILTYAERLRGQGSSEFGVLLIRDAFRKEPTIKATPSFTKFLRSDLGKQVMES